MLYLYFKINLLIATGMVGAFLDKVPEGFFAVAGKKGFLQLFMAVVVIGWILVLALFFVFLIGLHERFSSIKWSLGVSRYTFHTRICRGCSLIKTENEKERNSTNGFVFLCFLSRWR